MARGVPPGGGDDPSARRLWWAALDIVQSTLLQQEATDQGVWLAAPLPALYEPDLLQSMRGWVWTPPEPIGWPQLSPAIVAETGASPSPVPAVQQLPLRPGDGHDPLLIVISPSLQVALTLHGPEQQRQLLMRSDPATLATLLELLDRRLQADCPEQAQALREAIQRLGSLQSSQNFTAQFWPAVADRLARMAPSLTLQTLRDDSDLPETDASDPQASAQAELSLLEAITHEVRTPLATIRTLIRSLLRRRDLPDLVLNRLRQIDSECTEQIDRFGLIFHAAELHASELQGRAPHRRPVDTTGLARTDLGAMLLQLAPAWEHQLKRRGLALELDISPALPAVLSDPGRLEPMLGGLIDRSSRSLQHGGRLWLQLRPAGARLKLQIRGHNPDADGAGVNAAEPTAELGPVLSWNPGTGSLQLSQGATRRLLASLGGRLTQQRDRGLTVFFPVADQRQC